LEQSDSVQKLCQTCGNPNPRKKSLLCEKCVLRAYYLKNKSAIKINSLIYYDKHRKECIARSQAYNKKNKTKVRMYAEKYRKANKERCNFLSRKCHEKRRKPLRIAKCIEILRKEGYKVIKEKTL